MDSLAALENACFEEWRLNQRRKLVPDGAVDGEAYHRSSPRIVFVLKEVNDIHSKGWDLRDFLRKGGRGKSWNNIARWIVAVQPGGAEKRWADVKSVNRAVRKERFGSIVAMNVKKVTGGATANHAEIERFALEDAEYLERQFSLYEPEFTVFCGIDPALVPQFSELPSATTSRGIRYRKLAGGCCGIRFFHPQARYPAKLMYFALADAAEELRSQRSLATNGS